MTDPSTFDYERFDRELKKLYPQWEAFLKRSYSAIRANHSDLLQQAAEDLLSAVRNNPAREVRDWTHFGFQFLHRRIADHFRGSARRWAVLPITDDLPASDPTTDPERVAHYSALLRRAVAFIAQLRDSDRRLLLNALPDSDATGALTDAERKQLSRLRARLREELENK